MKKSGLLLIIPGLAFTLSMQAQDANQTTKADTSDFPYWIEMMQDPDANFYATQSAFEKYWEGREVTKGSGWKPFKRWEWFMSTRVKPDGSRYQQDRTMKAYKQYSKSLDSESIEGDWEELGPVHTPSGSRGLGRLNAIAFHPTDPDIIWVGAPSGGLWKSTDHGQSWSSNTDGLPTLGVSSIIVDYENPDVLYMGTGDRDHGDAPGLGVMKSTNGGQSWEFAKEGMGNRTVGMMVQHPADNEIILAATNGGIYKTRNAAQSWEQVKSGNFKDIVLKPDNPDVVYATSAGKFYKSTDHGDTWTEITNGLYSGYRGAIAVTPANPHYVYFILTNSDSFRALFRSTDGGESFEEHSTSPNIMSWGCNGGSGGQAWYDLDIAADPQNEDIIYAGGVNVFKSTDGGSSWDINSHWWGDCGVPAVHADLHIFEWSPLTGHLYAGNDGGISYTPNGSSWEWIFDGLAIAQAYKIGQSATDVDYVINGYQDNGTASHEGGDDWYKVFGGDGMECAYDPTDETISYATLYYGSIFRLKNNNSQGEITDGIPESGAWVTPFIIGEDDPNVMFVGYNNVWRTKNVKEPNTNSIEWTKISDINTSNLSVLEHSPANTDILYASSGRNFFRCDDAMSDNPAWLNLSGSTPNNNNITDIASHPENENIVYIVTQNEVYKSNDQGMNWENMTGSLPTVHMSSLAFYERSEEGMYLGTDMGVFYYDDGAGDWIPFYEGLPANGIITEVEIYYDSENPADDRITAVTFGRGLWASGPYHTAPQADFMADMTTVPPQCGVNFSDNSMGVPTEWNWTFEGGTPSSSTDPNPSGITWNAAGSYDVTLEVSNQQGSNTIVKEDYITVSTDLLPVVEFDADQKVFCAGTATVHFFDESELCPNEWEWTFDPNTISFIEGTNANSQNPVVQFNESGDYDVTLEATNSNGSQSLTKEAFISLGGMNIPYTQEFETESFTDISWIVINEDQNKTWELAPVGGNTPSTIAARVNMFNYLVPPGRRDQLISPPLDLSNFNNAYLQFKHAYAKQYATVTDSLIIFASPDCGETWTRIFEGGDDGSGNFATHTDMADEFIPETAEDWCGAGYGAGCFTIDLSEWAGITGVKVMFETYNFFGNNLYVDDVLITNSVGTEEPSLGSEPSIKLFPNPSKGTVNVAINDINGNMNLSVTNSVGNKVMEKEMNISSSYQTQIKLEKYGTGIYLIKFTTDDGYVKTEKIVIR